MIEKEIKLKLLDKGKISVLEKYIIKKGAIFLGEYNTVDEYFSHPCRDFKQTDEALRIRIMNNNTELTYKGSRASNIPKVREEFTVKVNNYEVLKAILLKLGFKPIAKITKHRKIFTLNGDVKIFIDSVDRLGYFVEVETELTEKILNFIRILNEAGVKWKLEHRTYLELYLETIWFKKAGSKSV